MTTQHPTPTPYICRHGKAHGEHWCDDLADHERKQDTTRPARTDVEALVAEAVQRVRDELEPAIDAVRRLHDSAAAERVQLEGMVAAPGRWCPSCGHETPCPTIRALNEAGA